MSVGRDLRGGGDKKNERKNERKEANVGGLKNVKIESKAVLTDPQFKWIC